MTTPAQHPLSIERIFSEPDLNGAVPTSLRFSPEASRVTFLRADPSDLNRLDLWHCDPVTGASELLVSSSTLQTDGREPSDQEKANRERRRIAATGIIDYHWSPDGDALIFPLDGILYRYVFAPPGQPVVQLTPADLCASDVSFSPDGSQLSFVSQQNLFAVKVKDGQVRQLTFDGGGTLSNGTAEFIAQEEMHRYHGYWWSPDSGRIAFIQTDESGIAVSQRYEIQADGFRVYDQRYPYAGMANARVRLGVIDPTTTAIQWLDLGSEEDIYLARVTWLQDSLTLAVQIQSRDQKSLQLFFYALEDGRRRGILREESDSWINLQQDPWFLRSTPGFILASERSGHRHLYLYDLEGALVKSLTAGDWEVHKLLFVDETAGFFYFTGGHATPTESHLYRGELAGSNHALATMSSEPGWHDVEFSKDGSHYIDRFSSVAHPPRVSLHAASGDRVAWLARNDLTVAGHPYAPYLSEHGTPVFGSLSASDGQLLYYRLTPPTHCQPGRRYPVILSVYGGPGVQRVKNEWTSLWHQYLVRRGFGVLELDNRGSTNRGTAFESPIYRELGKIEVADQLRGIEMVQAEPWADPNRIGVYGHSYGGYMALMLMMKAGHLLRAGVAVAPVTDWRLYDTHYTERYLSDPSTNPEGYDRSSVFPHIGGLQGDLLIIHGMADDNVLFSHSTRLFKALQDNNISFSMMTYPGAKHGLGGRSVNIHRFELVASFFTKTLMED